MIFHYYFYPWCIAYPFRMGWSRFYIDDIVPWNNMFEKTNFSFVHSCTFPTLLSLTIIYFRSIIWYVKHIWYIFGIHCNCIVFHVEMRKRLFTKNVINFLIVNTKISRIHNNLMESNIWNDSNSILKPSKILLLDSNLFCDDS